MRISLTQTILLSTALFTMNLPLTAMEETINVDGTNKLPAASTTLRLKDAADTPASSALPSTQSILFKALGFSLQNSSESAQTIINKTEELLSLEKTIDLNELYKDYTTLQSALPTQTSSDQEITATALRTITQMQQCDFTWYRVNDSEENAANEAVIDAIYPLTSPVESTENLALRLSRIAYLNATYETIVRRETDIHEQNKERLKAENQSTLNRINTEYGAKIKGITESIAIQEKCGTSTSTETAITAELGKLTNSVLSTLKTEKETEEANKAQAILAENDRYTRILEEEIARFNQKLQQEQTKFKSRLFDYALTRQTISKLRVIMQEYESMKQGINESEHARALDTTQVEARKKAEDNITDIKGKIIAIESMQKAIYPFSRTALKTIVNKPFLGIGSLLGKPTNTKAIRREITGIDTLPPEKVISLVFTGKESLDSAVQTLMQDYVSIVLTKSAALPNALAKGYITYLSAEEVEALARSASLAPDAKSRSNSQADSSSTDGPSNVVTAAVAKPGTVVAESNGDGAEEKPKKIKAKKVKNETAVVKNTEVFST